MFWGFERPATFKAHLRLLEGLGLDVCLSPLENPLVAKDWTPQVLDQKPVVSKDGRSGPACLLDRGIHLSNFQGSNLFEKAEETD